MSERSEGISVSLDDLGLTKEKAMELVNRMNEKWPGKYVLRWTDLPYGNNVLNPFFPMNYHGQLNPMAGALC